MNKLNSKIQQLKEEGRKALVAFITVGYPDLKATPHLVKLLEENGVDIVELGVPFSDPVADGPTIQFSSEEALKHNVSLTDVLAAVRTIRKTSGIPLLLMGYMNPFNRPGLQKAVKSIAAAGVDGLIIPDLIPEEAREMHGYCAKEQVSLVHLVAPTTPDSRMKFIDARADGFVYVVSLTGVTGGRKALPADVRGFLERTEKNIVSHSRFVGFGISTAEHVHRIAPYADGVIVGSAIIDIIRTSSSSAECNRRLAAFIRTLRRALDATR